MVSIKETTTIPTIDIGPMLDPNSSKEARLAVVEALCNACHVYGFFNLVGHGIPRESLREAFELNKMFFALPEDKKMEVSISKSVGRSFRGYEPAGIQTHHKGLLPDTKEVCTIYSQRTILKSSPHPRDKTFTHLVLNQTFMVGREVPLDDPDCGSFSTGPNLWPSSLPKDKFQDRIMAYQSSMLELVKHILSILAQGLPSEWECPPTVFDSLLEEPSIPMRFLHYGPVPSQDARQFGGKFIMVLTQVNFFICAGTTGTWVRADMNQLEFTVADHTDFGCVSILLQEPGTTGLEVYYPPTNQWVPVPVIEDGFVINMGDMMQKYTGGYYRSARHRVLTNKEKHRHSVAFFLNGNLKLNAKALDGSGVETVVGDHIRGRLIETMGDTGKLLQREVIAASN